MPTSTFLTYSTELAAQYKYLLVFIGAIVEGPILMIACGFLVRLGVFNLFAVYFTLMLGDLSSDVGWYYIGYFFGGPFLKRFGKFFGLTKDRVEKAGELFHKYKTHILFISKVTIGFGMALAIVIFAGVAKIPFKTYLFLNVLGEFIMVAALIAIGYFLGHFYASIAADYKTGALIVMIVGVLAVLYGFSTYVRSVLLKKSS